MINDITLGQFFPVNSPIHKLDPRVKILSSLIYIVAVFFANGFSGYLFVAVFTYGVILMSKVPPKLYIKGLKPLVFIVVFKILKLYFNNEAALSGTLLSSLFIFLVSMIFASTRLLQ